MNILSPYDAFNDVHSSSPSHWYLEQNHKRDEPSDDQQDDLDPEGQPCDPDDSQTNDPPGDTGRGGGSLDPPDNADLGGDEDTPQW